MIRGYSVGIDLGTQYSYIGSWIENHEEIIYDICDDIICGGIFFSYVTLFDYLYDNEILIGYDAMEGKDIYLGKTIYDIKRIIGRHFDDKELQSNLKNWPFKVIKKNNGKPYIRVKYKEEIKDYSPEEISAMIISYMKDKTEKYLGCKIIDAVITVPTYFNVAQRQATKKACKIAGLNVLKVINEPTAAVIAYGLDKESNNKKNVFIFDLKEDTFDVTILTIHNDIFEVKATGGDTHFGGNDFDDRLQKYLIQEFKRKYGKKTKTDISHNQKAVNRIKDQSKFIKEVLYLESKCYTILYFIHETIDFEIEITRAIFEEINSELFDKIMNIIEITLHNSGLSQNEIDEIVMTGECSRISKVQSLVKEYFNTKKLNIEIDPNEAVARGATILAHKLTDNESKYNIQEKDNSSYDELSLSEASIISDKGTPLSTKNVTKKGTYNASVNNLNISDDIEDININYVNKNIIKMMKDLKSEINEQQKQAIELYPKTKKKLEKMKTLYKRTTRKLQKCKNEINDYKMEIKKLKKLINEKENEKKCIEQKLKSTQMENLRLRNINNENENENKNKKKDEEISNLLIPLSEEEDGTDNNLSEGIEEIEETDEEISNLLVPLNEEEDETDNNLSERIEEIEETDEETNNLLIPLNEEEDETDNKLSEGIEKIEEKDEEISNLLVPLNEEDGTDNNLSEGIEEIEETDEEFYDL